MLVTQAVPLPDDLAISQKNLKKARRWSQPTVYILSHKC